MTYAELLAEVIIQTNRPDLTNETAAAVRSATLKMHQIGYWDRDLFETGIQFVAPAYFQQFDYPNVVPLFRALKYLRKYDSSAMTADKEFEVITPDSAFDAYGAEKSDVIYLGGSVFNIKSSTQFQYALLGCYLNPNITQAGYNSWIAIAHPYAIIHEAARLVFKGIGLEEESASQNQLVQEQIIALVASNTVAVGY